MLKERESLHGTYEPVSKASFTKQQLKQVIQTRWVVQPRPAQDGETSLRARFVAKGFKQQILDPSLETYASTPSHLSLRILLILSLVNHWDVVTADISSAFLSAKSPLPSKASLQSSWPVQTLGSTTHLHHHEHVPPTFHSISLPYIYIYMYT